MPRLAVDVKEARRSHILAAAQRCFARSGYHLTTIDDIAAEAGVSKGAPYVYFESKEALFHELYEQWECGVTDRIDASLARLDDDGRRSPRQVLEVFVSAVGDQVTENEDLCRVLNEIETQAAYLPAVAETVRMSHDSVQNRLQGLIEDGKACGEWPPETDAVLEARLIVATLKGLVSEWHLKPGSFSWSQVASRLVGAGS